MKRCLLLLCLLVFISSQPMPPTPRREHRFEELKERREKEYKLMTECILSNEEASAELKKIFEGEKGENTRFHFIPNHQTLSEKDHNIIRTCRKEAFKKVMGERERNIPFK